jgi:AraC-like DNA-binding protein
MAIQRSISVIGLQIEDLMGSRGPSVFQAAMKRIQTPSRDAVREAIVVSLRYGDATLRGTARRLGVSTRSLQRHLAEMSTSYSELVAEVRLDAACHLLMDSTERICDIAARLGYADAGSFSRIFLRRMKMQPRVFRRRQMISTQDQ